jgi:hypothetical protein
MEDDDVFRNAPQRDPQQMGQLFFSRPLDEARLTAARVAAATLAGDRRDLDLDDEGEIQRLRREIADAVSRVAVTSRLCCPP